MEGEKLSENTISLDEHKEIVEGYVNEIEELKEKIKQFKPKTKIRKGFDKYTLNKYINPILSVIKSEKKKAQQELIKELLGHIKANKEDLLNKNMNYRDAYGEIVTAIMLKKIELDVEVKK